LSGQDLAEILIVSVGSWPSAVGDQALERAAPSLRIAAGREF